MLLLLIFLQCNLYEDFLLLDSVVQDALLKVGAKVLFAGRVKPVALKAFDWLVALPVRCFVQELAEQ